MLPNKKLNRKQAGELAEAWAWRRYKICEKEELEEQRWSEYVLTSDAWSTCTASTCRASHQYLYSLCCLGIPLEHHGRNSLLQL